jgi:hypothetical protein
MLLVECAGQSRYLTSKRSEDQLRNVCAFGEFKRGALGLFKLHNELLILRLPAVAGIFHILEELHAEGVARAIVLEESPPEKSGTEEG